MWKYWQIAFQKLWVFFFFTTLLKAALSYKHWVSWRGQQTWKSPVSVTEMGDLFASAHCHFKCTHHAITGVEEHDRPAHSPAHCGLQDMRSCDLLLFSSNDHTPAWVMSIQMSENYSALIHQTFMSCRGVTISGDTMVSLLLSPDRYC